MFCASHGGGHRCCQSGCRRLIPAKQTLCSQHTRTNSHNSHGNSVVDVVDEPQSPQAQQPSFPLERRAVYSDNDSFGVNVSVSRAQTFVDASVTRGESVDDCLLSESLSIPSSFFALRSLSCENSGMVTVFDDSRYNSSNSNNIIQQQLAQTPLHQPFSSSTSVLSSGHMLHSTPMLSSNSSTRIQLQPQHTVLALSSSEAKEDIVKVKF